MLWSSSFSAARGPERYSNCVRNEKFVENGGRMCVCVCVRHVTLEIAPEAEGTAALRRIIPLICGFHEEGEF